jgi:hypothetical protein
METIVNYYRESVQFYYYHDEILRFPWISRMHGFNLRLIRSTIKASNSYL